MHEKRFETATDLRTYPCAEAAAGRKAVAQWCTNRGRILQELLDNAWSVLDAPEQVQGLAPMSRSSATFT